MLSVLTLVLHSDRRDRHLHSFPTRRSSDLPAPGEVYYTGWHADVDIFEKVTVALPDFCLRSEEHTSELQSRGHLVCRLLLEKTKTSQVRAGLPLCLFRLRSAATTLSGPLVS